jgi:hypothetical protein
MAGLDPAIHVLLSDEVSTWMPGTSPGMTDAKSRIAVESGARVRVGIDVARKNPPADPNNFRLFSR